MSEPVRLAMTEPSQVGEARRAAAAMAERLGFNATEAGKVAIVATEAATNLVKHAQGGEFLLLPVDQGAVDGIEILTLDKGPGMDLGRCLRDGYSTAGSPGNGLGAIIRLAASFDHYSSPATGTALLARMWPQAASEKAPVLEAEVGAIQLPKSGETACGDAWAMRATAGCQLFLVADGLGHGPLAAQAAREAVRVFHDHVGLESGPILQAMHAALRSTRGAAAAVARVDFAKRLVHFAGIGNIAGAIVSPQGIRSMVSHNGTLGHQLHKVQEFEYPFPAGALLVMHSDGLASHWRLDQYSGLIRRQPSLIAGVLYRDHQRGRDDVTVLVARKAGEEAAAA